jgi:hypothetical protein
MPTQELGFQANMTTKKASKLVLRRAPRISLLAVAAALASVLVGTPLFAQESGSQGELDSHMPAEGTIDQRPSGIDMMYGGVTIAGQGERSSGGETQFGLDRMYGGVSGSVGTSGNTLGRPARNLPEYHVVEKGDTLWDLSEHYYGSPWAWPQVWSLNPQIENPHWIYPGDQLRTARGAASDDAEATEDNSVRGGFIGRARAVPSGTVFVRDQGYLGDPERDVWGEVVGSHEDQMMLSDGNTIYLVMNEGVDLRLGQRLTIFKEIAEPPDVEETRKPPGEIVKIYGTVRVDGFDKENRVAKGTLIESIDVVERGFKVGPVGRRFDVVPPRPATQDVEARILTSLYPHVYYGKDQLVFIDKGSEDGLVSGNRLRAVRRGDTWRRNLTTANHHARTRVEMGAPDVPKPEATPIHGDDEKFPDEVVGEVTVLRTEEYSAICMVTGATRGLQVGERLVAVKGY